MNKCAPAMCVCRFVNNQHDFPSSINKEALKYLYKSCSCQSNNLNSLNLNIIIIITMLLLLLIKNFPKQ